VALDSVAASLWPARSALQPPQRANVVAPAPAGPCDQVRNASRAVREDDAHPSSSWASVTPSTTLSAGRAAARMIAITAAVASA
jgi:hypothetical protein